jgi:hypothetical protein
MRATMSVNFLHLHTHFLLAFAIDRELVAQEHGKDWGTYQSWIAGLDRFIAVHGNAGRHAVVDMIGPWKRATYTKFDLDSRAYQDMVFFHPYVRHVFFDAQRTGENSPDEWESLIRVYEIDVKGKELFLRGGDGRAGHPDMSITSLRMFLFANGIGILAIGCEAWNISSTEALWANEMLRKLYPSSGRQNREGRHPNEISLRIKNGGEEKIVSAEDFKSCSLHGFQPPLSKILTELLYFLDYNAQEYEQVLDERMIVYSYGAVDPGSCPENFIHSDEYRVLLSQFLYVDREQKGFRYDPEYIHKQMREHIYTRWAHEGTFYGFTNYSNISLTLGKQDRGSHALVEGDLIHRMFNTRYYLMAIVALFYRATLLDFAEKSALVSKRLYSEQETAGGFSHENIDLAHSLRAEFLHFTNYWYFEELANKEEENEHFDLQVKVYRLHGMKEEIEDELGKMNASLNEYYQQRSTDAVNRLAMLSMILGFGAVVTGFFGMNFGRDFADLFFEPKGSPIIHEISIGLVTIVGAFALLLCFYLIGTNWSDYKDIFQHRKRNGPRRTTWNTLRNHGR